MRPWPVLLLVGVAASASPREDELLASLATQERFDRDEAARRAAAWRTYERAHANDTIAPNFATRPYRLGDLVWCEWPLLVASTPVLFPSSIGSAYVRERTRRADIPTLARILARKCEPRHAFDGAVVHLRLGDIMCDRANHTSDKHFNSRQPPSLEDLAKVRAALVPGTSLAIVWGSPSDGITAECLDESKRYALSAATALGAVLLPGTADDHLCYMARAPIFVPGKGGFSLLAGALRTCGHQETIRVPELSDFFMNSRRFSCDPPESPRRRLRLGRSDRIVMSQCRIDKEPSRS